MKNTILEFKKYNGTIFYITQDGTYSCGQNMKSGVYNVSQMINEGRGICVADGKLSIQKVRRESDGRVFEIGDKIRRISGEVVAISKFYYNEHDTNVFYNVEGLDDKYLFNLRKAIHVDDFVNGYDQKHSGRTKALLTILSFLTGNNVMFIDHKKPEPINGTKLDVTAGSLRALEDKAVHSALFAAAEKGFMDQKNLMFVRPVKQPFLFGTGGQVDSMTDFENWWKNSASNPLFDNPLNFPTRIMWSEPRKEKNINSNSAPQAAEKKEIEFPLFITEDGMHIYKNDKYYTVCTSAEAAVNWTVNGSFFAIAKPTNPKTKTFSSRDVANEWIIQNKPMFSMQDMKDFECATTKGRREEAVRRLKNA